MKTATKYQVKARNEINGNSFWRYGIYTSKKRAQAVADKINASDPTRDATVVEC